MIARAAMQAVYAFSRVMDDFVSAIEPMADVLAEASGAKPSTITAAVALPEGVTPCPENEFTEHFRELLAETMLAIPGFNPQPGEAANQLNALMVYLSAYIVLCMYEIGSCPAGRGLGVTMEPVKEVARSISINFYEFMYDMYGEDAYEDDFLPW